MEHFAEVSIDYTWEPFGFSFRDFKNDHIQAGTVLDVFRRTPYCGNMNPFALIFDANYSNPGGVLFRSNDDLVRQGFNASYFAVNKTQKICKCLTNI